MQRDLASRSGLAGGALQVSEAAHLGNLPTCRHLVRTEGVPVVESVCRVCGLDEGGDRWTGRDRAQYVICSCCGAEAGVDDLDVPTVRRYRTK